MDVMIAPEPTLTPPRTRMTVAEFATFAALPENNGRGLQLIAGDIVEMPSNPFSSAVGMRVAFALMKYLEQHNLGYVTGEQGGYTVQDDVYAPDVGYISYARQRELVKQGFNPIAPDLAVEVVSSDTLKEQKALRLKTTTYLSAGTIVWIVNPDDKTVEVYVPGQPPRLLTVSDTLDGGALLPGFTLAVAAIFPTPPETTEQK